MVSVVDLSRKLHESRAAKTGRPIGSRMLLGEVWSAALDCEENNVSEIILHETRLPKRFDGMFVRLKGGASSSSAGDKVLIYIEKNLDKHLKEFVAIKELMHCWSSKETYISDKTAAEELVKAFCNKHGRYTPAVAADSAAILAAAEVMLPHYTVEWHIRQQHDAAQIAASHDLHPDIAEMICRLDFLAKRKNAHL